MSSWPIWETFKKYETKIALFVGFLLVSSLSFEAGVLWGQKWRQEPLIVEKEIPITKNTETANLVAPVAPESTSTDKTVPLQSAKCTYVGSKNSTKFYLSNCSWAKKIKPENLICFSSPEEAISQGRTESICSK